MANPIFPDPKLSDQLTWGYLYDEVVLDPNFEFYFGQTDNQVFSSISKSIVDLTIPNEAIDVNRALALVYEGEPLNIENVYDDDLNSSSSSDDFSNFMPTIIDVTQLEDVAIALAAPLSEGAAHSSAVADSASEPSGNAAEESAQT